MTVREANCLRAGFRPGLRDSPPSGRSELTKRGASGPAAATSPPPLPPPQLRSYLYNMLAYKQLGIFSSPASSLARPIHSNHRRRRRLRSKKAKEQMPR